MIAISCGRILMRFGEIHSVTARPGLSRRAFPTIFGLFG
jgi:hypothetical protein